ncbi:MAG: hydroxymethylbilane synthase [Bacteroidetes bacterium]|nr:hydroxymethylbilane synthase [Bacteroidota bacterium]MCW5897129.1 hydroxymethylbilane synthase [Bacteroidota bacterium]
MAVDRIIIGSRGSELALWQAHWVQGELLKRFRDLEIRIDRIKTKGDKILDSPLSKIGDKGLFTREIEEALLTKQIDLAVHSLKDLPTQLPDGLMLGAICEREDVRDVFIPHPANQERTLLNQPQRARIATGSLRRKCQLLNLRPDFEIIDIRGNLNTRMKKLEESDWAGMILARAGVVRLGWEARIGESIDAETILPAVGQGALGIEIRVGDTRTAEFARSLHHHITAQAALAERALLRKLEGGCQVPIGTFGRVDAEKNELKLDAIVGSLDGKTIVRGKMHGSVSSAENIGSKLAETLLAGGADRILDAIRSTASADKVGGA